VKTFIITYYDGDEFRVEQQKVDVDIDVWELNLPCSIDDINSVVELYRPTQPEHKVWLVLDGNFVEQPHD